ncbi:unnamed protein product [Symbiodinium microadriaticum]|nr:unnamed protein product [Symbiodinium microadriaticum]
MRHMQEIFSVDISLKSRMSSRKHFKQVLLSVVRRGYGLRDASAAKSQHDSMCDRNLYDALMTLFDNVENTKRPFLTYAITILDQSAEPDLIVAKLSEVCDRAIRCASARRQAFNTLVTSSFQHMDNPAESKCAANVMPLSQTVGHLDNPQGALARLAECFEDYIDDHKEKAFNSSVVQPCRFYFHLIGDNFGKDHVNIHGMNWYLAVLHATLGIQLPVLPQYSDTDQIGVAPYWERLGHPAWDVFCNPSNFGKDFEGIPELRRCDKDIMLRAEGGEGGQLFCGLPREVGNEAVNPDEATAAKRKRYALIVNRFAHFFTREFFIRKAIECLNSEIKPEHAGFRRACQTLYRMYRDHWLIDAETFVEYIYDDDMFTSFNEKRAGRFLAWLGVVKPIDADCLHFTSEIKGESDESQQNEPYGKLARCTSRKMICSLCAQVADNSVDILCSRCSLQAANIAMCPIINVD